MTTVVRDPWSDAREAATRTVLDPDVARARRRIGVRRALVLVLELAALLAAWFLVDRLIGPSARDLRRAPLPLVRGGYVSMGVGLVLFLVGNVRATGADRPFVTPDAFLSRSARAWLRTQVAENRGVPDERRVLVVADAARRMVVNGRHVPADLGIALLYVGAMVVVPAPSLLLSFSALTVWLLVRVVRDVVWSRRARRWLSVHAPAERGRASVAA